MHDQNSYGYSVSSYDEVVSKEPISVEEVKLYIGVGFDEHDASLKELITSCRFAAEYALGVTLIDSRKVKVSWLEMRGDEELPYNPISGPVTATSLDGQTDYEACVYPAGIGLTRVKGNFPNGVVFSYDSVMVPDGYISAIKAPLVRAVAELFENSSVDASTVVRKQLKGFRYVGSFIQPS